MNTPSNSRQPIDSAIRIGTLVKAEGSAEHPAAAIERLLPLGFESFSLVFSPQVQVDDLGAMAARVRSALAGSQAVIASLGLYGNPQAQTPEGEQHRQAWIRLIDAAPAFGCDIVSGWAGRIAGLPIDRCIDRFVEVFTPLARRAGGQGVRLAFENCAKRGNWESGDFNIAHGPRAWQLMFDALPMPNLGLQWEPCHALIHLVDPLGQLRGWAGRMFHLHGKDGSIDRATLAEHGIHGAERFAWHRFPGLGETDWREIFTILHSAGFTGSIDIEGWHDPVYKDDLEMAGQIRALHHLKLCRMEALAARAVR